MSPQDFRNVALVGHGSTGKTTLTDQILVKSGAVNANPSVDAGTSICDFDDEEKLHKYSIEAAVTHFDHLGKTIQLIDCPGYPELIGQTIGALRAVELAVIAIDAHSGIKVNTRRVWQEATEAGVGKAILITKMDTENIDVPGLMNAIKEIFGNQCVPLNVPLGQGNSFRGVASTLDVPADTSGAVLDPQAIHESLVESIVEADDELMEKYLEGEVPPREKLTELMSLAIAAGSLTPVLFVSTRTGHGVTEF
ncbi:MAG TPA: GTP-binding protein, partial [Pirellulaceae bacterium]